MDDHLEPVPLLSDKQLRALDLCRELRQVLSEIIEDGGGSGLALLGTTHLVFPHLWVLEQFLKAQAAARAYPDRFLLLGQDRPTGPATEASSGSTASSPSPDETFGGR